MNTQTIILIFISIIAFLVLASALSKLPRVRHTFIVPEGYAGLLYQHGKFIEVLAPGRHVRWGRNFTIDAQDSRKAFLAVAGQEVLTSDNIGVKLSLVVTYQVADPVKAARETQNWHGEIHNAAQLALRHVVSGVAAEPLLTQRLDVAPQFLARVQPDAAKIGITVHAVDVKDVMLPAELKRAFGDVLKAKQEGQAALERARGESAPLRVLQSLATARSAGNTLVLGMPAGFVPMTNGKAAPAQSDTNAGET